MSRALPEGIIHANSRFRRDARSLEEEEESWFEQEDENTENGEEAVVPQQDQLNNDTATFKSRKTFMDDKENKVVANEQSPAVNNKKVSRTVLGYLYWSCLLTT